MITTAIIIIIVASIMIRLNTFNFDERPLIIPIIFFLTASVVVGSVLSFLVGKKIIQPLNVISNALQEVRTGNFDVVVDEDSRIPEFQEMTKNFNLMTRKLGSIETLRNDFIVNVSHEFKTPLAAIEGYATLLQEVNLTAEERFEYTSIIIEASQQLSTLTGNILQLSKIENDEIIIKKDWYRIDEQMRRALLILEPLWSKKNLELQLDLPSTLYYGNAKLLMQAWLNLLSNAIKFTPDNGLITITLEEYEEILLIIIRDSGCGIDASVGDKIFEKFYQHDNTRSTQGNGLGLSLVKRIIELSDGKISYSSLINVGTTFQIELQNSQRA